MNSHMMHAVGSARMQSHLGSVDEARLLREAREAGASRTIRGTGPIAWLRSVTADVVAHLSPGSSAHVSNH